MSFGILSKQVFLLYRNLLIIAIILSDKRKQEAKRSSVFYCPMPAGIERQQSTDCGGAWQNLIPLLAPGFNNVKVSPVVGYSVAISVCRPVTTNQSALLNAGSIVTTPAVSSSINVLLIFPALQAHLLS